MDEPKRCGGEYPFPPHSKQRRDNGSLGTSKPLVKISVTARAAFGTSAVVAKVLKRLELVARPVDSWAAAEFGFQQARGRPNKPGVARVQ